VIRPRGLRAVPALGLLLVGGLLLSACGGVFPGDKLEAVRTWSGSFEIETDGTLVRLVSDDWPTIAPVVAVCTGEPATVFADAPPDQVVVFDDPACAGSVATSAIDERGSLVIELDRDLLPERYATADPWTLVIAYSERNGQVSIVRTLPPGLCGA
jgi:hypothetical protein